MEGKHDDDDRYIRNATHSDSYLLRLEKIIWRDLTADENSETVVDAASQVFRIGRVANKLGLAHKPKKQSTGKRGDRHDKQYTHGGKKRPVNQNKRRGADERRNNGRVDD
jgi:hypothetical protein